MCLSELRQDASAIYSLSCNIWEDSTMSTEQRGIQITSRSARSHRPLGWTLYMTLQEILGIVMHLFLVLVLLQIALHDPDFQSCSVHWNFTWTQEHREYIFISFSIQNAHNRFFPSIHHVKKNKLIYEVMYLLDINDFSQNHVSDCSHWTTRSCCCQVGLPFPCGNRIKIL